MWVLITFLLLSSIFSLQTYLIISIAIVSCLKCPGLLWIKNWQIQDVCWSFCCHYCWVSKTLSKVLSIFLLQICFIICIVIINCWRKTDKFKITGNHISIVIHLFPPLCLICAYIWVFLCLVHLFFLCWLCLYWDLSPSLLHLLYLYLLYYFNSIYFHYIYSVCVSCFCSICFLYVYSTCICLAYIRSVYFV